MGTNPGISLTDQAYRTLEALIVTLQIAPGAVISEGELCTRSGFGRTPVREAIQRLAQQRLVSILPRRGMFVTDINLETQLHLLEFSRGVEDLMVRLAARRRTGAEAVRFTEIATAMDQAAATGDDAGFMILDQQFNELLGATCRNPFAQRSMEHWNPLSRRFWYQHHQSVGDLPQMARLHADLAWTIAAGEPEAAGQASDLLITYLASFTRAALEARVA